MVPRRGMTVATEGFLVNNVEGEVQGVSGEHVGTSQYFYLTQTVHITIPTRDIA